MLKKYMSLVITLIVIVLYIIIQLSPLVKDNKGHTPIITFNHSLLKMSVKDNKSKLLDGVKALDDEDGDISSEVEIESVSYFFDGNKRQVHYIVFDSDDNVTHESRIIEYVDYTPPIITLTDQLRTESYSTSELMKRVKAYSCIDGDISSKITVMNVAFVESGVLNVQLSASDSTNTSTYLNLKYYLEDDREIDISLEKYILYKKTNEDFDFRANIGNVVERLTLDNSLKPYIKIKVPDMSKPGVYEVEYTLTRSNGNSGKTTMVVVVE